MKPPTFAPIEPPPPLKPGEPYFLLRAQDVLAVDVVEVYADKLRAVARNLPGAPVEQERLRALAHDVDAMADYFRAWQRHHPEQVRLPD